jgi:hypothetical protein
MTASRRWACRRNHRIVALALLVPIWPGFGVLPVMLLMSLFGIVSFTVGKHLHSVAESSQRATLLSVRGLAFNLGFSLLLVQLRKTVGEEAFRAALFWQLPAFASIALPFFAWTRWGKTKRLSL